MDANKRESVEFY